VASSRQCEPPVADVHLAAGIDSLPLLIEARASEAPAARKPPAPPEANPWLRL
jgi:hypothetical protein